MGRRTALGLSPIRFLAGLASAFVMVFLASIVFGHLAAAGRGDLQAVHFGGVGVGIAMSSPMMAGLIRSMPAGRRAGSGRRCFRLRLAGRRAADRSRPGPAGGIGRREPPLPHDRPLTSIIVAYGLFGFGYIVTATFLIAIVRAGGAGRLFETGVWLATGLRPCRRCSVWDAVARRGRPDRGVRAGCLVEAVGVAASVCSAARSARCSAASCLAALSSA